MFWQILPFCIILILSHVCEIVIYIYRERKWSKWLNGKSINITKLNTESNSENWELSEKKIDIKSLTQIMKSTITENVLQSLQKYYHT